MKIIKHGNKHIIKDTKMCCQFCGCIFKFNQADCDYRIETIDKNNPNKDLNLTEFLFPNLFSKDKDIIMVKRFSINCPECKSKYNINDNLYITISEEKGNNDSAKTKK